MPLGLKFSTRLVKCGRCGKSYSNPLTHVCKLRLDKPRRTGRTLFAPKVSASVKCGTCHKQMANPLTHVCAIKTDFKARQKAAGRKPRKPPHSPSACRDDECRQRGCEGYKLGYEEGYDDGFAAGHAAGSR